MPSIDDSSATADVSCAVAGADSIAPQADDAAAIIGVGEQQNVADAANGAADAASSKADDQMEKDAAALVAAVMGGAGSTEEGESHSWHAILSLRVSRVDERLRIALMDGYGWRQLLR